MADQQGRDQGQERTQEVNIHFANMEVTRYRADIKPEHEALPGFSYDMYGDWSTSEDIQAIIFTLTVRARPAENDDPNSAFAEATIRATFGVTGLAGLVSDNRLVIPNQLLFHIAGAVLHTARGVMMGRGHGTVLERLPISSMDPSFLLPQQEWALEVTPVKP